MTEPTRAGALARIAAAYVAALSAAATTLNLVALDGMHPLWEIFIADSVATVVVFGFSFAYRNSSTYDAYWSVVPPLIAAYLVIAFGSGGQPLRRAIVCALVLAWGVRLTWNWARGWTGMHHEDWRYGMIRDKTGALYWPVSFLGIHYFPTVQVFLGCLPLYPALTSEAPLGVLDAAGALVTAVAIWIEGAADNQLRHFVQSGRARSEVMNEGLWAYSRHPNYFGEITFWWGLWLFALAVDTSWWWTGAGALSITVMFRVVSLPMMEKRMLERRPAFAEQQRRVSAVVPWFPSR